MSSASAFEKLKALREIILFEVGVKLRPYQLTLSDLMIELALLAKGDELAVLQSRQSGKTEAIADTLLILSVGFPTILKRKLSAGIFAPAFSQATVVARRRLYERFSSVRVFLEQFNLVMDIGAAHFSQLFILEDVKSHLQSRVRVMSGAPNANIIGETLDIAVIEQVEEMEPTKMQQDIFPMLSATGGLRILSGTPSLEVKNTYYYDVLTKPEKQRPPWGTNPNGSYIHVVDWREAAKYSETYRDYVMREAERIGGDSDVFRTAFNIEWITLLNKFISRDQLEALSELIVAPDPKTHLPYYPTDPKLPRTVGWDPARGADRSVMTVTERDDMFHHHILEWMEFEGLDWEPQLDEATELLRHWKPNLLLIDSTGEGDPIPEFARKWARERLDFHVDVEGYKYTSQSKDVINKLLDAEMHMKRVFFPIDTLQRREREHFKEDFLNLERNYAGNYMNLDHPSRSGCHNDYCTSLELALWASLKRSFTPVMREVDFI